MFNLRLAADYLLYRFKAKTRHGTHSPFVYRLVDKVIYDFRAKKVYEELVKFSDTTIKNNRSTKLNQLIYRFTVDWNPATIVGLGEPLGTTSRYLQKAAPNAKIYAEESFQDKPDLIFINTDKGQDVLSYFKKYLPKAHAGTMLIIDDIYANNGMKEAWTQIKLHPQVTITIDLFQIGLVYFRTGQVKEDFVIKFV